MVYRKRYYRPRKGKKHYKRKYGWSRAVRSGARFGSLALKAYMLARKLADHDNVEYKFHDTTFSTTYDYNGGLILLNNPAQGDTDQTRDGDSLKMQNLTFRGTIIKNGAANDTWVRIIILFSDQNKIANVTDWLDPAYVGSARAIEAPKDWDKRFYGKTLYDKTFTVNSDRQSTQYKGVIKINKHTQFEAGSTTINTGALQMIVISNEPTNTPTVSLVSRLSFTDN